MPLSVLEMEVEHLNKRDLHRIRETKLCYPLTEVFCNPVKNVLALFLAEVLFRVVKDTEPDQRLFDYLYESIHLLEYADKGVANFHLVFLLRLLHYMGIYPNADSYSTGCYFDMQNGVFVDRIPMHRHYLNREESQVFPALENHALIICRCILFPVRIGSELSIVSLNIIACICRTFRK